VQINDSSESVMSNIAEGFGRGTQEEFITFLGYAIGSLDETQSHLCSAYDREYLTKKQFARFFRERTAIRKLTVGFIRSMIMPRGGVRRLGKRQNWSNQVWEIYERLSGKPRPALFEATRDAQPARNDEPPV
jgi:four helix bundle protein